MNIIHYNDIKDVRKFYGKKYSKIFDVIEKKNGYTFSIDADCSNYLELWFHIGEYYFYKVNIGIDDKYHLIRENNIYCKKDRYTFDTQKEVVDYLETQR